MANEDLSRLTQHQLELEFVRAEAESRILSERIESLSSQVEERERALKGSRWNVGLSTLATIGGFAAGIATPLGVIVAFAGVGLLYHSGRGCFDEGARCEALAVELDDLRDRLSAVTLRATLIQSML